MSQPTIADLQNDLIESIEEGDMNKFLKYLEIFVQRGISLDFYTDEFFGSNPLQKAISEEKFSIANKLLENGANPNFARALNVASKHCNTKFINKLINYGADINDPNSKPILSTLFNPKCLNYYLQMGADPNTMFDNSGTLHQVMLLFNPDKINPSRILLAYGADPNMRNTRGETPLMLYFKFLTRHWLRSREDFQDFIRNNNVIEVLDLFINYGGDLNAFDDNFRTIYNSSSNFFKIFLEQYSYEKDIEITRMEPNQLRIYLTNRIISDPLPDDIGEILNRFL